MYIMRCRNRASGVVFQYYDVCELGYRCADADFLGTGVRVASCEKDEPSQNGSSGYVASQNGNDEQEVYTSSAQFAWRQERVTGQGRGVQATLSAEQHTMEALNATMLTIAAQRQREIFGTVSSTTLDGGLNSCENCASVGLDSVPKGTDVLKVIVEMTGSGWVHLTSGMP